MQRGGRSTGAGGGRREWAAAAVAAAVGLSIVWTRPVSLDAGPAGLCAAASRIMPGAAVGALWIGMPLAESIALLGAPSVLDHVPSEDPRQWEALATAKATRIANVAEAGGGWAAAFYDSGPNTGLSLYALDGRLGRITLDDTGGGAHLRGCATKEGIRLGSPRPSVQHEYGPPEYSAAYSWDAFWIYDTRGIFFRTARGAAEAGESVIAITIFGPGTFCQIALTDPRKISPALCP